MMYIISMNLILSMSMIMMKHPLSMGVTLMMQTMIISMTTNMFSNSPWFSYILFLIMIGGMLILFMYMTNIASNKKFKISFKPAILIMMMLMMLLLMLDKMSMKSMNFTTQKNLFLSKFMMFPMNILLLTIMVYLFITLIAVVKITKFKNGPFRTQ